MGKDDPAGWRVKVTAEDGASEQLWLAAIPNKDQAEKAVRNHPGVLGEPYKLECKKSSKGELTAHEVAANSVKQVS